ncbi:hypothetical protein DCCM_0717 [Desulfocucumis palustris]|uniref:Uncharacterized protein n=1 Tax=Desulfocucumis palustris TaxID=1898651 RepID=A0A2L2XFA2_9FIRM|nr:hypothetical protein DCCM_0717 [Desulfocucumis palustris]
MLRSRTIYCLSYQRLLYINITQPVRSRVIVGYITSQTGGGIDKYSICPRRVSSNN